MTYEEKLVGCMLGLALGDAFGAPWEGGPLERMAWGLLGRVRFGPAKGRRRWTDDTTMTLDVAESWLSHGAIHPEDLALRFARSYRWSRGYGPGAAKILKRIRRGMSWTEARTSVYAEGSFGNGGAMRAPLVGVLLWQVSPRQLAAGARQVAEITHAHRWGIEGAQIVACAAAALARGESQLQLQAGLDGLELSPEFRSRLDLARRWTEAALSPAASQVARELGHGIAALDSAVTAVYLALRFLDASFCELLDFCIELGGDVDTIAAMAGALWGTWRGAAALPKELLRQLEAGEDIEALARKLAQSL